MSRHCQLQLLQFTWPVKTTVIAMVFTGFSTVPANRQNTVAMIKRHLASSVCTAVTWCDLIRLTVISVWRLTIINLIFFYRATLCIAQTRKICPSSCLSHAGILSKGLNIKIIKLLSSSSRFSLPDADNIPTGTHKRGRRMQSVANIRTYKFRKVVHQHTECVVGRIIRLCW